MLKKLRLDKTRTYEIALATKYIAEMLDSYIDGRSHSISLGCEQGDIEKWDDLIVELENGVFEHVQIKRQLTNFSNDPVERGNKKRGVNIGDPQDRSPLDESITSLAIWSKNKSIEELNQRRFVIEVPDYTVQIKKDYQIRNFYDLCTEYITATTTSSALEEVEGLDPSVSKAYKWLTTWCDFEGWDHIIKALRILSIRISALEDETNNITEKNLSRHFIDGVTTRKAITSYIDENSKYTVAIKPRQLLSELENELIIENGTWTQYKKNGASWDVSGITNLKPCDIEPPKGLIKKFWVDNNKTSLKIISNKQSQKENCKLAAPLMRFSLHFDGNSDAVFNELDTWVTQARHAVGGTLGISDNDFESLSWSNSSLQITPSEKRALKLTRQQEEEAKLLTEEMYDVCWVRVCEILEKKISQMINHEVRDAIEERWIEWRSTLESDVTARNLFLRNMLSPKGEGDDLLYDIRVGPKTASLLADGIKFLLIVSTALNDKADCWRTAGSGKLINTLALSYWSGPSGKRRYARELTDDDGIEQLLGNELNNVLIMSQIQSSSSDILDESLAFGLEEKDSLATSKTPDLIVTNSSKFKRLIKKGSLQDIKTFLDESLKSRERIKEESIQGVIDA